MKKKLIIFDMDGLLLDSEKIAIQCWEQVFIENNIKFDRNKLKQLIGMGQADATAYFEKEFKDPTAFKRLVKMKNEIYLNYRQKNSIDVKQGIIELISMLKKHQVKIAVATSTSQEKASKLLKETNLYDLFDYHMFGDMVENSKPNPEIFLNVLQYFKVSQEETLVLEDSFYGVKAANNGNIDVIWIKDIVDIDQRGDVSYLYKFDNAYQAINAINNMIE